MKRIATCAGDPVVATLSWIDRYDHCTEAEETCRTVSYSAVWILRLPQCSRKPWVLSRHTESIISSILATAQRKISV